MTFTGFSDDLFAFYRELAKNNNREWWLANKGRYDEVVRRPSEDLMAALEPEFGALSIFRPNRDVRFSADKRPYTEHLSFARRGKTGGVPLAVRIGADGVWIAGGYWQPTPAQLTAFRTAIDSPVRVLEAQRALDTVRRAGFDFDSTKVVKTVPRGWSPDHPHIDLLRLTTLAVHRELGRPAWLSSADAVNAIAGDWRTLAVWGEWVRGVIAA